MNNAGMHFITSTGRFDLSAIMRRAASLRAKLDADWMPRHAARYALMTAWAEAKGESQLFQARNQHRVIAMREVARDTYEVAA